MAQCDDSQEIVALAGYTPESDVRSHAMIDLDILQMKILTYNGAFDTAADLYRLGKNSVIDASNYEYNTLHALATNEDRLSVQPLFGNFEIYNNNDQNYADTAITGVLSGSDSTMSTLQRAEIAVKASSYQVMYMAALTEFQHSKDECDISHYDKGVAYLIGSLEGTEVGGSPTSDGTLMFNLANKRCSQFGTCNENGYSRVSEKLMLLLEEGKIAVEAGDCDNIPMDSIDDLLQIPLMQAILRYAIKCERLEAGDTSKDLAEGDVFARSVLPLIAADDQQSAQIIGDNAGGNWQETCCCRCTGCCRCY